MARRDGKVLESSRPCKQVDTWEKEPSPTWMNLDFLDFLDFLDLSGEITLPLFGRKENT